MHTVKKQSKVRNDAKRHSMHRMGKRMDAVRRRWHELVVKESIGTITSDEHHKLDRYQALLRYKPSAEERKHESRRRYEVEQMQKQVRRLLHEVANSPNDQDEATA